VVPDVSVHGAERIVEEDDVGVVVKRAGYRYALDRREGHHALGRVRAFRAAAVPEVAC
jgi:hypothetical protein